MSLDQLLIDSRFLVILGRGGVGKTTVSATLAVKAASLGLRTVVLTIDPANRLADALGIDQSMRSPTRVNLSIEQAQLYGLMMDRKETCDELVTRFSEDETVQEKILANPYYHHFSTSLAGGQEYMAIEKVRQLLASNDYDLVVLDTPPSIHAFDFLDAPNRLIDGLKRMPSSNASNSRSFLSRLKERGGQMVLDGLKRFTGGRFLVDLTVFLGLFRHVLTALVDASKALHTTLREPSTQFIFVDGLDRNAEERLLTCRRELEERELHLAGLVYNRMRPRFSSGEVETFLNEDLANSSIDAEAFDTLKGELERYFHADCAVLEEPMPVAPGLPIWSVPIKRNWVSTTAALEALSQDIRTIQ